MCDRFTGIEKIEVIQTFNPDLRSVSLREHISEETGRVIHALRRRLEELTEYRGQTIDAGEFTFEVNTEGAILPDNLSGTRTAPNGPL